MFAAFQKSSPFIKVFAVVTIVALLFQYGHFAEHIIQAAAWVGGHTQSPYMTEIGHYLSNALGTFFFPIEDIARTHLLGMELLHLFGNAIYFVGVFGLWYFIRGRTATTALVFQAFHFYEHISLTLSYYFLNKPIGFSTIFGLPMDQYTYVAYRVWWHFLFNAIPTVLSTIVILSVIAAYKEVNRKSEAYA
jgi:hypothetical protein